MLDPYTATACGFVSTGVARLQRALGEGRALAPVGGFRVHRRELQVQMLRRGGGGCLTPTLPQRVGLCPRASPGSSELWERVEPLLRSADSESTDGNFKYRCCAAEAAGGWHLHYHSI